MEERNMQLDDDGKIKMRKNREDFLDHPEKEDDEEIVIDVPDFAGFREEDDNVGLSGDELSAKNQLYEQYVAEKKAQAEKIFEQAEALFAAGELESAGEKYLDSVAVHGGNWKAWFGVVRVQTKDMTDFSGIYDCQNAYNRALKRAGKAGKEELAATYDARLKQKIAENAEEAETLEEADAAYRASKRDGLSAGSEQKALLPFPRLFRCRARRGHRSDLPHQYRFGRANTYSRHDTGRGGGCRARRVARVLPQFPFRAARL